jgi:hypothetical protein
MTGDYQTALAIVLAQLPARHVYGRRVRASSLKAVLWAVWSRESEPTPIDQLARRACLGPHLVRFALAAMVRDGLLTRTGRRNVPAAYTINRPALDRLNPDHARPHRRAS